MGDTRFEKTKEKLGKAADKVGEAKDKSVGYVKKKLGMGSNKNNSNKKRTNIGVVDEGFFPPSYLPPSLDPEVTLQPLDEGNNKNDSDSSWSDPETPTTNNNNTDTTANNNQLSKQLRVAQINYKNEKSGAKLLPKTPSKKPAEKTDTEYSEIKLVETYEEEQTAIIELEKEPENPTVVEKKEAVVISKAGSTGSIYDELLKKTKARREQLDKEPNDGVLKTQIREAVTDPIVVPKAQTKIESTGTIPKLPKTNNKRDTIDLSQVEFHDAVTGELINPLQPQTVTFVPIPQQPAAKKDSSCFSCCFWWSTSGADEQEQNETRELLSPTNQRNSKKG